MNDFCDKDAFHDSMASTAASERKPGGANKT